MLHVLVGDPFFSRGKLQEIQTNGSHERIAFIYDDEALPVDLCEESIFSKPPLYVFRNPSKDQLEALYPKVDPTKDIVLLIDAPSVDGRLKFYKDFKSRIFASDYILQRDHSDVIWFIKQLAPTIEPNAAEELSIRLPSLQVMIGKDGKKSPDMVLDTMRTAIEIDKIQLYCGEGQKIRVEDVRELIDKSATDQAWDLIAHIFGGDARAALRDADLCILGLDNAMKFCGLLGSECRMGLLVMDLMRRKLAANEWDVINYVSAAKKINPITLSREETQSESRLNMHVYRIKRWFNLANSVPHARVVSIWKRALECSKDLRIQPNAYANLMTDMICDICGEN